LPHRVVEFEDLRASNLVLDAYYEGGQRGNAGDDPISKLLPVGTQGGFRTRLNASGAYAFVVLYSSLDEPDWPDNLDEEAGLFTYYGDNRRPGHALHDTPRKGNELLRGCFEALNSSPPRRDIIPPFFVFTKGNRGRDVVFRGLAAPGSSLIKANEQLIAIWKNKAGQRFQNYRAIFTMLNVDTIPRIWISDLIKGNSLSGNCPVPWKKWVETGVYHKLQAPSTLSYRVRIEQTPSTKNKREMVYRIYEYFKDNPTGFEPCAAEIAKMMDDNIVSIEVTRPARDGGRDAIGKYRIGTSGDNIKVDFALEAKCYKPGSGVGTRWTSRLISRLRYRQFGILVTTSHLGTQAYKEIRGDNHPIIVIAGEDIANILLRAGIGTPDEVTNWLEANFPK